MVDFILKWTDIERLNERIHHLLTRPAEVTLYHRFVGKRQTNRR